MQTVCHLYREFKLTKVLLPMGFLEPHPQRMLEMLNLLEVHISICYGMMASLVCQTDYLELTKKTTWLGKTERDFFLIKPFEVGRSNPNL